MYFKAIFVGNLWVIIVLGGCIFQFYQKVAVTSYNKYHFVYFKRRFVLIGAVLGCQENFDRFRPLCALSKLREEEIPEEEVAAFEEVQDPWYLKKMEDIRESPRKYQSWKVENGRIYKQRVDHLLGPITGEEDT